MNTIKKALIVNGHSWLNKGDAALIITAVDLLKQINVYSGEIAKTIQSLGELELD